MLDWPITLLDFNPKCGHTHESNDGYLVTRTNRCGTHMDQDHPISTGELPLSMSSLSRILLLFWIHYRTLGQQSYVNTNQYKIQYHYCISSMNIFHSSRFSVRPSKFHVHKGIAWNCVWIYVRYAPSWATTCRDEDSRSVYLETNEWLQPPRDDISGQNYTFFFWSTCENQFVTHPNHVTEMIASTNYKRIRKRFL